MFIPVATLWCFCGPILVLLNVPVELAYGSQRFLRALCPFAVGYIVFEALKKFLQCQGTGTRQDQIVIWLTGAYRNRHPTDGHSNRHGNIERSDQLSPCSCLGLGCRRRCYRYWKHVLAVCHPRLSLHLAHRWQPSLEWMVEGMLGWIMEVFQGGASRYRQYRSRVVGF